MMTMTVKIEYISDENKNVRVKQVFKKNIEKIKVITFSLIKGK